MASREGRHRLADPGEHLVAALHSARGVLDVVDIRGVLLHPVVPVFGLGGAGHRLLEILERGGQLVAAKHLLHARN